MHALPGGNAEPSPTRPCCPALPACLIRRAAQLVEEVEGKDGGVVPVQPPSQGVATLEHLCGGRGVCARGSWDDKGCPRLWQRAGRRAGRRATGSAACRDGPQPSETVHDMAATHAHTACSLAHRSHVVPVQAARFPVCEEQRLASVLVPPALLRVVLVRWGGEPGGRQGGGLEEGARALHVQAAMLISAGAPRSGPVVVQGGAGAQAGGCVGESPCAGLHRWRLCP